MLAASPSSSRSASRFWGAPGRSPSPRPSPWTAPQCRVTGSSPGPPHPKLPLFRFPLARPLLCPEPTLELSRSDCRRLSNHLPPTHPLHEGEKGWEAEVRGAVVGSSDEEGNGLRNRETKLWLSLGGFQQRNDDDPDKM
mmetsp:Transcript_26609/g.63057  ORF Transcript_26609/g.63057 Transcript_26609/m.63057 type:complete len:139 (-) Transcript_26609:358-774(-)